MERNFVRDNKVVTLMYIFVPTSQPGNLACQQYGTASEKATSVPSWSIFPQKDTSKAKKQTGSGAK